MLNVVTAHERVLYSRDASWAVAPVQSLFSVDSLWWTKERDILTKLFKCLFNMVLCVCVGGVVTPVLFNALHGLSCVLCLWYLSLSILSCMCFSPVTV